jgi:hypothetical protein
MRPIIAIVSLGIMVGCGITAGDQSETNGFVRSFDGEKGMQPGVGYKDVLEDTAGVCVKHDGVLKAGDGQEVYYKMNMIEDHYSLAKAFNLSNATQIKAVIPDTPISVSAKSNFAFGHSRSINKYSVTLLVSTKIKNETEHLNNIEVKESVVNKLNKDLESQDPNVALENFRMRCGDSFLSGYTTGGEFYGIIEIQTDSDDEKSEISSELTSAIGLMGVGDMSSATAISSALSKISKSHKISAWSYQMGGKGEQSSPAITVDDMLARLQTMTTSVMNGENPRKITATFSDYFSLGLDLPATQRNALRNAQRFIAKLAVFQSKLLDAQANIEYTITHPNSFVGADINALSHLQDSSDKIDTLFTKVYDLALDCEQNLKSCNMPSDLSIPQINFPERKHTTQSLNKDYLIVKTTQHSVVRSELPESWFNSPECYVKVVIGAKGKSKSIMIRRSITNVGNRCSKMNYSWKLPVALIKNTATKLGSVLDDIWINVIVMEDDPSYDDNVAEGYVWFKNVNSRGAETVGINSKAISMTADFEVR